MAGISEETQKQTGEPAHADERRVTLEKVMGIVLCVSRIDQETLAYTASMSVRSDDDMLGERRKNILRDMSRIPPAMRYAKIRKSVNLPDVGDSLRKIRKVRNNLAHNVDIISADGAYGRYDPPVSYSRKDLNDTLDAANACHAALTKIFEKHPKYIKWVKTRD